MASGGIVHDGTGRGAEGQCHLFGRDLQQLAGRVVPQQQAGQLGTGVDTELAVNAREVSLHGLAGDEQCRRGVNVAQPPPHGPGDLEFLRAEDIQGGWSHTVPGVGPDAGRGQLGLSPVTSAVAKPCSACLDGRCPFSGGDLAPDSACFGPLVLSGARVARVRVSPPTETPSSSHGAEPVERLPTGSGTPRSSHATPATSRNPTAQSRSSAYPAPIETGG
jgi:hypothetical protein